MLRFVYVSFARFSFFMAWLNFGFKLVILLHGAVSYLLLNLVMSYKVSIFLFSFFWRSQVIINCSFFFFLSFATFKKCLNSENDYCLDCLICRFLCFEFFFLCNM